MQQTKETITVITEDDEHFAINLINVLGLYYIQVKEIANILGVGLTEIQYKLKYEDIWMDLRLYPNTLFSRESFQPGSKIYVKKGDLSCIIS